MSAVGEVLRSLDAAMHAAGARWYLFGAQAALLHGSSRLTADVDATVACEDAGNAGNLDLAHVRSVLAELESALDRRDLMPVLDAAIADTRAG
jgi:hypothetical protein